MSNGDASPLNNNMETDSPLPQPTVEQQLFMLQQDMHALQQALADKQAREREDDIEDSRIAKILKVTLALQAKHKDQKISRRAFTFTRFDGRKIGNIVLAWLSQFDDYFSEESFSELDKIKCATNHLSGKASLWWNVTRNSSTRPATWTAFQELIKQTFLPAIFHLQARRAWSSFSWIEGKTVSSYTGLFLAKA